MDVSIFYGTSNIAGFINTLGYAGIAAIILAETGLFFCFFLPGDSLLITAGMLAAGNVFDIEFLIPLIVISAFAGYFLGYWIGGSYGALLHARPDTWYYKKSYTNNAHRFMEKYGRLALTYGRLVPVIRTFIPLVAGMGKMPLREFALFNFLGAALWGALLPLLGYYLGSLIPNLTDYLLVAVLVIIVISLLPTFFKFIKKHK